jgi:hypothetical protein
LVRQAIQYQATIGSYYSGTDAALARAIANTGVPWRLVPTKTDKAILAATLWYLGSCHPVLLKAVRDDFFRGLLATNRAIALAPFDSHLSRAIDRAKRLDAWVDLAGYRYVNLQDANAIVKHARRDRYIGLIATGIIMFLGNMVCVYYMDRYALVLLISSAIGAAAALAGIAEIGVETPECIMTRPAS